uniref:Citrate transporter-like domain-containing protein n=1 Tax=Spongospora subterranea TaxID=70186 RepID=A0A0H5RCA3_9EUKA|eukprot:CRZ11232.1 hypothetical protein [Spongospora subterranea]
MVNIVAGGIICFIGFIFSLYFTLRPARVFRHVWLSMSTAPIISVALLLATQVISFQDSFRAIVGIDSLRPYTIIILFQSLAYLCLSLNQTGVLKWLSISMMANAGSSYKKIFVYIFILATFLTVFTSNDIVILTLTPIVCHLSADAALDPIPLLFVQFFSANTVSTIFFFSNPTNIVVSDAYGLTFWSYVQWMLLPSIAAGVALLMSLFWVFRREFSMQQEILKLSHHPLLDQVDVKTIIPNRIMAGISVGFFSLCLFGIVLSSLIGIAPWVVCLCFGATMFVIDLTVDVVNSYPNVKFQRVLKIAESVPFGVTPFILGMFILVEALNVLTLTGKVSVLLAELCGQFGVVFSTFFVLVLSMLFCNLINNQPMTILFVGIIKQEQFLSTLQDVAGPEEAIRIARAIMFSIVLGSNFGANITFIGSLAGILWKSILFVNFQIDVSLRQFFRLGMFCMAVVVLTSGAVLALEVVFDLM